MLHHIRIPIETAMAPPQGETAMLVYAKPTKRRRRKRTMLGEALRRIRERKSRREK